MALVVEGLYLPALLSHWRPCSTPIWSHQSSKCPHQPHFGSCDYRVIFSRVFQLNRCWYSQGKSHFYVDCIVPFHCPLSGYPDSQVNLLQACSTHLSPANFIDSCQYVSLQGIDRHDTFQRCNLFTAYNSCRYSNDVVSNIVLWTTFSRQGLTGYTNNTQSTRTHAHHTYTQTGNAKIKPTAYIAMI